MCNVLQCHLQQCLFMLFSCGLNAKQLENLIAPNTEHNYVVGYKNYKTPKAFHTTLVPVRLHKVML